MTTPPESAPVYTITNNPMGRENASNGTQNGTTNTKDDPLVESQSKGKARGSPIRQIIASIIANLGTINTGFMFGFSAVVIPQLKAPGSSIPIDENQASWIASMATTGTPFGCIFSGYLTDVIGRKWALIITQVPIILGWIMVCAADRVELLYAGRFFIGFGTGMVGAPARVYTSEATQPHLRAMLTSFAATFISFGVLLQYLMGSFLKWQILSIISTMVPVAALVLICFMPETPNFLVAHNKIDDARNSLKRLRGSSYNVNQELEKLEEFNRKINANGKATFKEKIHLFFSAATLKPFGLLILYFFVYQFSGINAITFYAVEIFQNSGTTANVYTCTILMGVVRLVFTFAICIVSRRLGRRPLTFISGIGCGLSMLALGAYLYYKHKWDIAVPPIAPTITWFPVACIFAYTISCTCGFLIIPWVLMGEMYPQKVRGIVGGMTACSAHLYIFVVVKTYPMLCDSINMYGTFMLYGCISIAGIIFFYFTLPETKGRSLAEIEDYFSGRTKTLKKDKSSKGQQIVLPIVEKDKLIIKN